ncbi:hypothetical protein D3C72_2443670 [compost metagenome]
MVPPGSCVKERGIKNLSWRDLTADVVTDLDPQHTDAKVNRLLPITGNQDEMPHPEPPSHKGIFQHL